MRKHTTFPAGMDVFNRAWLAVLLLVVLTPNISGQTTTSLTLRLNVADTQGNVVPGATVFLNTENSEQQITGVTAADGTVTFVDLQPGTSNVTVKATGFQRLERSVTVRANESNNVTLSLTPTPIGSPIMNTDEPAKEGDQEIANKIKSLRLSFLGRFIRGLQYQYQITEQRELVLVDFRAGSETETRLIRNPEKYLQKHTVSFKFTELFADRLAMFKRGTEYANADAQLKSWMCDDKPLITCLTKRRWWKRALMGISLEVYASERQAIEEQILVTSPAFGHDFQVSGGLVFDPAKLFPTASDWKATFDAVQGIDPALALLEASDLRQQPWKQRYGFLIPKFEFKVLTQFDLVKFKEVFIRSPKDQSLNTWTLTWDLTRMIPDTKNRLDADALTQAVHTLKTSLVEKPQKQCVLWISNQKRDVEVKPAFSADSCKRLADLYKADRYELGCKDGKSCEW
jgi:Carboxypeptidase regulatory-like domain